MTNDANPLKGNNPVPRQNKVAEYNKVAECSKSAGHELIQALQRQIPPDCRRLVIALSGGLDSMVLLEACYRLRQHIDSDPHADGPRFSLAAIHVNHQLQTSALAWQQHCQQQCQQRQVHFICHAVTIDTKSGSIEDAARQQRYRVFRRETQAGDYFVTGHHQDDQIETILMRWLRAASRWGIARERGLMAGLESEPRQILTGRPFLDFDRQQLEHIAEQWQLQYVQDPSNQDTGYERNWWRHHGIPTLRQRYADLNQKLQQSWRRQQSQLQLLNELLEPHYQAATIDVCWPNTLTTALNCQLLLAGSNDLALALLQQWLVAIEQLRLKQAGSADFKADSWSRGELINFIDQLRSTESQQTFAWSRSWGQIIVWRSRIYAVFADEPCASTVAIPDNDMVADDCHWSWSFNTRQTWPMVIDISQDKQATNLTIVAASRVTNKKIKPHQRPSKTFKALFQEAEIPSWLRAHWPVIIDRNDTVIALLGIAVKEGYQLEIPSSLWAADTSEM